MFLRNDNNQQEFNFSAQGISLSATAINPSPVIAYRKRSFRCAHLQENSFRERSYEEDSSRVIILFS